MNILNTKKLSQGRSMAEMLGVLGIMALITALGIIAYTQANKMFKLDRVKNDISTIRIHIQSKSLGYYDKYIYNSVASMDNEIKDFFKKELIDTGVFKTGTTPIGSDTYYGFGRSTNLGNPLFIAIVGLTKSDCESILASYEKSSLGGDSVNRCDLRTGDKYRLVLYF